MIFACDVKAILIALGRKSASSNHYCFYSVDVCTRKRNRNNTNPICATTTMGRLRELADLDKKYSNNPTPAVLAEWKADRTAEGLQGSGVRGNFLKDDYLKWVIDAQRSQVMFPLFKWIPDEALLLFVFVIESLHMRIQTTNKFFERVFNLASTWTVTDVDGTVKSVHPNLYKITQVCSHG
jgi:hypothetical protein